MLGKFVTAKLKGLDECRQGAVISLDPLRIRGESGEEYDCEGTPSLVANPPETCIGCDLPLGSFCKRCETNARALGEALDANGLTLVIDSTTAGDGIAGTWQGEGNAIDPAKTMG